MGDLGDYLTSKLVDPISRLQGVGDTQVFGAQYAMRIWLDPYKLNNYKLMPSDAAAAVLAQNVQVPAGELGARPAGAGQELDATVNGQSRLKTADQFKAIILKTASDGSIVRLGDVARVEIGGDAYTQLSRLYERLKYQECLRDGCLGPAPRSVDLQHTLLASTTRREAQACVAT